MSCRTAIVETRSGRHQAVGVAQHTAQHPQPNREADTGVPSKDKDPRVWRALGAVMRLYRERPGSAYVKSQHRCRWTVVSKWEREVHRPPASAIKAIDDYPLRAPQAEHAQQEAIAAYPPDRLATQVELHRAISTVRGRHRRTGPCPHHPVPPVGGRPHPVRAAAVTVLEAVPPPRDRPAAEYRECLTLLPGQGAWSSSVT